MDEEFSVDKSLLPLTPNLLLPHHAFPPVRTWLEDVGQTALNQVAQVTQIQNCKPHWYSGCFPSKKPCSFFPPLPPSLWVLYLSCRHDLISHLCGKALEELPATPLCPEVLSIAVDLLFISGQDQGGGHQVLSLASSGLTAGPSCLNHLLSQ